MKLEFLNFIFLLLTTILVPCTPAAAWCNHSCGGRKLPFPFGFSPGCPIQLNCTSNGTILAAEFPVQSVSGDTILVNLPPMCGRPVEALRRLFSANFAPTSHNAILLQNCRNSSRGCFIPTTMVQTHFELLECEAKNDSISCYSETNNATSFIDYNNLTRSGCGSLFSAISMESFANSSSVSLDVQIVRIGWLQGPAGARRTRSAFLLRRRRRRARRRIGVSAWRASPEMGFATGWAAGKNLWDVTRRSTYRANVRNNKSVAAGASLMISLGLVFCFIRKRSKLRSRSRRSRQLCETTGITVPIYQYKEMEKATDFFSEKRRLGNGAYGTVYSGKLNNDEWVAIKRIRHSDSGSIEQVINEIKLLSSVSHPNLVRLLGCSIENDEQILVYEFMPNGTLSQHLQREKGSGLPWPVRLTIAAETAQAISYLHNAMHPPIYHRDIKSSNILLDYNFKSKVADFGLSRLGMTESSHISTAPQGTPGYLDPQYHQHFHLSDKSDVYSFGVVLIEIITALKVVDFSRPQNEVNLAALAVDRIGRGHLDEIIDPFLEPTDDAWTLLSVQKVAELAFRCLAFHKDMRPSMMEVAIELEQIRLSKWTNSDTSIVGSSEALSRSSSSNLSEKPLNVTVKKHEFDSTGLFSSTTSLDTTDLSPVSADDSWQSDQSSPSSNSLLNRVIR
ncbi:Wall-associated receptor kinase-like 14 [Sesamum angolense]|uniref:Wall-associated receptor kinase-like 14 n=1 Tax=Sesamum angolense TaxID=2727404 RepID=A0AAE1WC79_9LAMI|nr:Wall-associated receptor kinase-like 14 [Sesamum angolense]